MVKRLITVILFIEFILLGISNSFVSNAQNFERFSNKEGFNQNTINAIAQDKYGFLWFGTPNGLIKYDGYDFETYTVQSKTNGNILTNNINSLHNDSKGVLWIGTNVGINVYIPKLDRFYTVPLFSKLAVSQIISDPNGQDIWFSGENQYNWKLLTNKKMNRTELYNINTDWAEEYDVAAENPEIVKTLAEKIELFQKTLPKDPPANTFSKERETL